MIRQSDVRRINQRFVEAFGRPDGVNARYKWVRTTDLAYFVKIDNRTAAGLYLMSPKYERHTWAEVLGDTWVVARWKAPEMSSGDWLVKYGGDVPYPTNGRYLPIENTRLYEGMDPSSTVEALVDPTTGKRELMPVTDYAIWRIREELEKDTEDFLKDSKAAIARCEQEHKHNFSEMVDSDWPAFDNAPGMKAHVSFPTPDKAIIQPHTAE
jgi:hypothetical protein